MGTLTRSWGSEQTNGIGKLIDDDASPGVSIHTASDTVGINDEVLLYAANTGSTDATLYVVVSDGVNEEEYRVGIPYGQGQVLVRAPLLIHDATISCYVDTGHIDEVYVWADVIREDAS